MALKCSYRIIIRLVRFQHDLIFLFFIVLFKQKKFLLKLSFWESFEKACFVFNGKVEIGSNLMWLEENFLENRWKSFLTSSFDIFLVFSKEKLMQSGSDKNTFQKKLFLKLFITKSLAVLHKA